MRRTNLEVLNSPSTVLATTAYGYDRASRLGSVTRLATAYDANSDTVTNSYLANSPLVGQITFKQNSTTRMATTRQYDYLNRLSAISSQPSAASAPPIAFNYSYNNANQRTQDKLADGSYWVYQYDSLGQVTSGSKYFYDGTPVPGQQFGYNFDTIGNRTQTKAGGDQTGGNQRLANYWANNLNQITNRDYPGTNDIIGVVLATNSVTVNGQSAWHKWEYFRGTVQTNNAVAPAWLTAIVGSGGTTNTGSLFMPQTPEHFAYDADGNLTNDGRWAYTWDAENRLIGMAANTSVGPQYQLAFAYDAKGRRIQKIGANGGTVTTNDFLYDGWNLVAELQPNNTPIRMYVWGIDLSGSIQGAGGVGGLLEVSYYGASVTNCFAAFDGNGNLATLVSSADGTAAANYEYGPFGEVIRATGPMAKANPIRFSAKYQDDESDLLYYGARYFKTSTGTWLIRDPAEEDEGGPNLYGFAGNDPISQIDTFGLMHVRFEVDTGNPISGHTQWAGTWSQPFWAGDGDYSISAQSAWSKVDLNNAANSHDWIHHTADYCNTVWVDDPSFPDGMRAGHAGEIRVYAVPDNGDTIDGCGGSTYQFVLFYYSLLDGSGPAPIYSTAYLFTGSRKPLYKSQATESSPIFQTYEIVPISAAFVDHQEQLIAIYQPLLGFRNRDAYGGNPSYGTAYGSISVGAPIQIK